MIETFRTVAFVPLLTLALAASVGAAPGKGQKPEPCSAARYLVVGGPIVLATGADIAAVQTGSTIALDGACNGVAAKGLRANRKGVTQLHAMWKNCADLGGGRARLDGRITDGCKRFRGTLRAKGLKRPRHFDGVLSQCGDGTPDEGNGEACDDGNLASGDGCEPTCAVTPPPSTTTTQPSATTTTVPTTTVPTTTISTSTSTTLPGAGLSLAAIASPDPVAPGGRVTYRLTVANAGTVPLTGVKLRLKLPNGSDFYGGCQMDGGERLEGSACDDAALYEWTVAGTLDAGVSLTVNPTIRIESGVTAPLVASVGALADGVDQRTAAVTTMVAASPPLQLAMVGGPDPAAAGEQLAYTITFGNRSSGTAPLPSATLTAAVPPGTVLDRASVGDGGQVAADGSRITWPLGALNPGAAGQRTFAVTVANLGAAESWIRQATAELRDGTLPQPNSARASAVTVVETAPALQLVLGTTLDPVQSGRAVTYQLTATNLGPPLTGVRLRLKLPNGSDFYGGCQMDGGERLEGSACDDAALYEWTVAGTLATGASVTVIPSIRPETTLSPGTLLATIARVVADGGRSAGAAVTTVVAASPPLQLAMVGGPDPAAAGEQLAYTITFGNRSSGTAPLPSATLTAAVPPGTVLDRASVGDGGQVAADGSRITWPLGALNPGAAGQRTFAVTVANLGAAESWIRQATAELRDGTLPQPNSARASAVTVVETAPALQLVLGTTLDPVQIGSAVTYQLTATNLGPPLTGVRLRLKLPNGSDFYGGCQMDGGKRLEGSACDDAALYEWTVAGTLATGATVTVIPSITTERTLSPGSLLATIARVVADGGRSAGAAVTTVVAASPPLQLAMVGGPDPAAAGEQLAYTITFGNRSGGTAPLPSATLTAAVPPGTVLDRASVGDGGQVAADGSRITWPLGALNPGAAGQRTFAVTVANLGAAESWIRQATAELRDGTLPQPNSARASAVTVVETAPALQLVLGTTLDPVQIGSAVTYQLTATNLGPPLTGVRLRLKLPNGSDFYGGCQMDGGKRLEGSACDDAALYEWTVAGTLATGATVTVIPSITTERTLSPGSLLATIARVVADGAHSAGAAVTTRMTH